MCVKTYWLERRISIRGFLQRYKGVNEISLNWSDTIAYDYYFNIVFNS